MPAIVVGEHADPLLHQVRREVAVEAAADAHRGVDQEPGARAGRRVHGPAEHLAVGRSDAHTSPVMGMPPRRPTASSASISSSAKPACRSTARVSAPACTGGRGSSGAVALNRGAGAFCTTPLTVMNAPPGDVVRVPGGLGHREHRRNAGVGALQQRAPLVAGPRAEDGRQLGFQGGPPGARDGISPEPVGAKAGGIQAGPPDELLVELRLEGRDGQVLAVEGLVGRIEVRGAAQEVGAGLPVEEAGGPEAVEHRHLRVDAVEHRGIHHLSRPGARGLEQCAHEAEGQQHAAATEVAEQVERRHRRLRRAHRRRAARRRARCSSGRGRGHRPAGHPGPSRSPGRRPGGDCAAGRRRARRPAARRRRGGSPR